MPSPFECSSEMNHIFWNMIGKIILDDPRTDWSEDLHLGYPFEMIRDKVLAKGLADFSRGHDDSGHGPLTVDEKALLYCFINLKKHFFACFATFEMHRAQLEELFLPEESPLIIDVGCGPATASLALADFLPGRNFNYLGIEMAVAMRTKAFELWNAAHAKGCLGKTAKADFKMSWDEIALQEIAPATSVMIIFSYFFASHTLTMNALQSLARFVQSLAVSRTGKPLLMVYLNSTNPLANRNYEVFKQQIGLISDSAPHICTIEYRKKKGGPVTGKEEFLYEVTYLKGKQL